MIYFIIFVIAFLLGLYIGKYLGGKTGYKKGYFEAPIMLRQKSYEEGQCALCGNKAACNRKNFLE